MSTSTTRRLRLSRRTLLGATATTAAGLALTACGKGSDSGSSSKTVTVVTHDSFHVPDDLIKAFEKDTGCTLEITPSGDAGELVNKLVLTKDAPLGDAVFGIDNAFAARALDEGVIDTSATVTLPDGVSQYVVDSTPALAPVDFGEVAVNVDSEWFAAKGLTPPATLEDLTSPTYKDLFVAINPSTSSTGLAFLLATIGHFGTDSFAQYWKDLVANGTKIVEGWTQAYETDFTASGAGGAYPVVVSYSSSPSATVREDGTTSATASLPATAIRQVEYAGVLAGAANPQGAKKFVSWMLSADVQSSIPDNMYMYPVSAQATLPEALRTFGPLSESPIEVAPDDIAANREAWLATWTEAVGQ